MAPSLSHSICRFSPLALACGVGLFGVGEVMASARDSSLGAWREYARQGVVPEYHWNDAAPARVPTVLSSLRDSRRSLRLSAAGLELSLSTAEAPAGYAPASLAPVEGLLARDRSAIHGEFVASSISRDVAGFGQVELTAVVAHQRYASAGFGTAAWISQEDLAGLRGSAPQELSAGHGVRMGYSAPLNEAFALNLSVQSKIDMDAFKSYRGVYSEAGDFDLPARIRSQLQWNAAPNAALAFGIERVLYSEISAFTSATLPTRFLSLLGDGSSPEFAWRDLTVYSLEGTVVDGDGGQWSLRYTTRQQPSPTSRLLERAISDEFTDSNWAFGYKRELGAFGQLWLAASYAPSRYFLGAAPYTRTDLGHGSQAEVEALWTIPF
jgi:hypothetical protein